jgi:hypothetical protein
VNGDLEITHWTRAGDISISYRVYIYIFIVVQCSAVQCSPGADELEEASLLGDPGPGKC